MMMCHLLIRKNVYHTKSQRDIRSNSTVIPCRKQLIFAENILTGDVRFRRLQRWFAAGPHHIIRAVANKASFLTVLHGSFGVCS